MRIAFARTAAALITGVLLAAGIQTASASTVALDSSFQCSAGTAANGISVGDVTGNSGGSDDCWGTYDGNDPGPGGAFTIDGTTYDFLAKTDYDDKTDTFSSEGADIGLTWTPGTSGTWSIDAALNQDFLIVLKAANSPGYAVWSFFGDSNDSTMGDWLVAWGKDLSHMSIYSAAVPIPLPAGGLLLLTGLGGLGLVARNRRRKAA